MKYHYYIFPDKRTAKNVLIRINKSMGYEKGSKTTTWSEIKEHPITNECLLPYSDDIKKCKSFFKGFKKVSKHDAMKKGWFYGFHKGRYAKVLSKLEEAEFLIQEIKKHFGTSFFTVQKAFLLSFAYACYSIKENLALISLYKSKTGKIKNQKSSESQEIWWLNKWNNEINKKGEIVSYFNELHNNDKHTTSLFLTPVADYFTNDGVLRFIGEQSLDVDNGKRLMSSEGFFEVNTSGIYPIRKPFPDQSILTTSYGIKKVHYKFAFEDIPKNHLGKKLECSTPICYLEVVINYYRSLVIEAIKKFPCL